MPGVKFELDSDLLASEHSFWEGRRVIEHKLSSREKEVVDLAGSGLTSRDIGERLGLAEVTVKGVLARLMRRFDCENRVQLISLFSPQPKDESEPSE